jgi:hypothetical protein
MCAVDGGRPSLSQTVRCGPRFRTLRLLVAIRPGTASAGHFTQQWIEGDCSKLLFRGDDFDRDRRRRCRHADQLVAGQHRGVVPVSDRRSFVEHLVYRRGVTTARDVSLDRLSR